MLVLSSIAFEWFSCSMLVFLSFTEYRFFSRSKLLSVAFPGLLPDFKIYCCRLGARYCYEAEVGLVE